MEEERLSFATMLLFVAMAWAPKIGGQRRIVMDAGSLAAMPAGLMPLGVMLDAWDRKNAILKNLLRAVPAGMEARVAPDAKSVREMFLHMHGTWVFFLNEDAPEFRLPFGVFRS